MVYYHICIRKNNDYSIYVGFYELKAILKNIFKKIYVYYVVILRLNSQLTIYLPKSSLISSTIYILLRYCFNLI